MVQCFNNKLEEYYKDQPDKDKLVRQAAEADLEVFIKLIAPYRMLGSVHRELISWWNREDAKTHQLTLLPRDHGKSAMIAFRVAWTIAKRPDIRVLYISSTANLAEKQLKAIKDILDSKTFRKYWPHHTNDQEGKREKWTSTEIALDHPIRKDEGIRDSTVFTGGLTTSLTGLHCDITVMDDVVVMENAYSEEGRNKVKSQYSLLSSIETGDALQWIVGTRYHPKDLYSHLLEMEQEVYDENNEVIGSTPVYEHFQRTVEDLGDGTGNFLWPKQMREDGKWFGFDVKVLARKRAQYLDKTQFYAQYYNNPNNPEGTGIDRNKFQYYDKKFLTRSGGTWYYNGRKLNVVAAIDFAYSLGLKSDHTALVVVGTDCDSNHYVLDIDRFQTERISIYYEHIVSMLVKWGFKKLRAETTAAQASIVKELKDNYIRKNGLVLSIEEHKPSKASGTKETRIKAALEPIYDDLRMWHFHGGQCQILEDELVLEHPPHDDTKDALASAIEIAKPPTGAARRESSEDSGRGMFSTYNNRFGGFY